MKKFLHFSFFLFFATILLLLNNCSCKKTVDQLSLLPAATTTGANTFGCLVNGQAMVAQDAKNIGGLNCPLCGNFSPAITTLYDNFDSISNALNINVNNANGINNQSPIAFSATLHFVHLYKLNIGEHAWQEVQEFGTPSYYFNNYITGEFYTDSLKGYAWYDSYNGSGTTIISRCDTTNRIISGTINGTLKIRNGTKTISLTNGRFDVKY